MSATHTPCIELTATDQIVITTPQQNCAERCPSVDLGVSKHGETQGKAMANSQEVKNRDRLTHHDTKVLRDSHTHHVCSSECRLQVGEEHRPPRSADE